jgi:hypothetical protein
MVKTAAILFGIVFLAIGILGFVPAISPPDASGMPMLLHIFMVNGTHSVIHIASGIIFLIAGMAGVAASRMWFRIFGIIYAVVAILGFMTPSGMILGMISNNVADTWLHVVLAVVMLFLGFVAKDTATA